MLPFDLKRPFTNTRFRCDFCSYKRVQSELRRFSEMYPIRNVPLSTAEWSRNRFESSVPSVNKAQFGTLSATLCFAIQHSANTTLNDVYQEINLVQGNQRNTSQYVHQREVYKIWVHHRYFIFKLRHKR